MEYVFLFLLFFVCVTFILIIRSKSATIKNIEQNNLAYRKHIDYLETHQSILYGEINVYKERINYLLKELDKEPDDILFKIESPNKEPRLSKEREHNSNEKITAIYHGYKVKQTKTDEEYLDDAMSGFNKQMQG